MKHQIRGEKSAKKYKTDTIKQRAIYVYLPSTETANRWKKIADDEKISISKFVMEHVENSLNQEKEHAPRVKLIENLQKLKDENLELRKQNKMLNKVVDSLDEELRSFRLKPFLDTIGDGIRQYETELIDLFRRRKFLKNDELLDVLNINATDSDSIKAVNIQLENLQRYGLIKVVPGGWKWKD